MPSPKRNFAEFAENWSTMSLTQVSRTCPLQVWWVAYFAEKKLHSYVTFISFTKIYNLKNWNYFSQKIPVFHQEFPVILMGRLDNQTPTGAQRIFFRTKSVIRRKSFFWFWRWWSLILNWGEIHCSKESKTYLLLLWWSHDTKDLNFQYEYLLVYFCNRPLIKPASLLLLEGRKSLHRANSKIISSRVSGFHL